MNMTEMGEVVAYLLRYRAVERLPSGGRKRRAARDGQLSERDVCALIDDASDLERENLRDFLAGQGLRLKAFESGDYPGIAPGSRYYALLPDPDMDQPPLYTREPVFDALRLRQESRAELATWYLQLWLLMHTLMYTRYNRALSDVSRYQEATFSGAELLDLLRDQVETLRSLGDATNEVQRSLLDERGEDLSRRVRAFIDLHVKAGFLESLRDDDPLAGDVWQQTLLGALESEQIGVHQLEHLQALADGRSVDSRVAGREDMAADDMGQGSMDQNEIDQSNMDQDAEGQRVVSREVTQ